MAIKGSKYIFLMLGLVCLALGVSLGMWAEYCSPLRNILTNTPYSCDTNIDLAALNMSAVWLVTVASMILFIGLCFFISKKY